MDNHPLHKEADNLPISVSPSTGSDLHALSHSPLALTWSSGEIPVLLYDNAYMETFADISLDSLETYDDKKSSISGPVNVVAFSRRLSQQTKLTRQRHSTRQDSVTSISEDMSLSTLETSNNCHSVCSVGTFGPVQRTIEMHSTDFSALLDNSATDNTGTMLEGSTIEMVSTDFSALVMASPTELPVSIGPATERQLEEKHHRMRRSSALSLSDVFSSPSIFATPGGGRSCRILDDEVSGPIFKIFDRKRPTSANRYSTRLDGDDSLDASILETHLDTPKSVKTLSWISSRDWNCQQYKDYINKENLSRVTPGQRSIPYVKYVEFDSITPQRDNPLRKQAPGNCDRNVVAEYPVVSPSSPETGKHLRNENLDHHRDSQSNVVRHQYTQRTPPKTNAIRQEDFASLQNVTVQFLIDQEGFRAAQPSFRYSSVALIRATLGARPANTVMAQFIPSPRQAFHFHYAPFETAPNLRRVTVNFDDNLDYLSRQALLTLKFNGVYVLHGFELSHLPHDATTNEPLKLYWQFEYLIDDRIDASGKIMEGEKILMPLNFSCSPDFIVPGQGKKNNIMQVFRKSVAPKLVAEKLQPPGALKTNNNNTGSSPRSGGVAPSATGALISHFNNCKTNLSPLHQRGQSHSIQRHQADPRNKSSHLRSPLKTDHRSKHHYDQLDHSASRLGKPEDKTDYNYRTVTRRRASSAGQRHGPSESSSGVPHFATTPPQESENRQGLNILSESMATFSSPTRHIIPPAKMTELMDAPSPPNERNPQSTECERGTLMFTPLTPRPRQGPRHVRDPSGTH